MKRLILIGALAAIGCSPMSPTPLKDGDQFICRTQPRTYTTVGGKVQSVVDYYAQSTPCPKEPIQ